VRFVVFAIIVILGMALVTLPALAAPCAPGTLQDYIDLAAGCTIGSATFSNFSELSPPAGATPIPAAAIGVTPIVDPASPGLLLTLNVAATTGEFLDAFFGFQVADTLGGASATMAGASAGEDGAVTLIEDLCLGAAFVGVACGGDPVTQILFAIDGDGDTAEATSFPGVGLLGVLADIGVDGGLFGSAGLATATLRFETGAAGPVPEPPSIFLLWPAIVAAVWFGYRSPRAQA
jgi:hypothetical protein